MVVTLAPREYLAVANVGFLENATAIMKRVPNAHGLADDGYSEKIAGAVAEYVVSKALGANWQPVKAIGARDVGAFEVRSTGRADGRLILHERDPDDVPFVLVTGSYPRFTVRGWILGGDGKQPQYWGEWSKRPAYFVPQAALQPIETLQDFTYANHQSR